MCSTCNTEHDEATACPEVTPEPTHDAAPEPTHDPAPETEDDPPWLARVKALEDKVTTLTKPPKPPAKPPARPKETTIEVTEVETPESPAAKRNRKRLRRFW